MRYKFLLPIVSLGAFFNVVLDVMQASQRPMWANLLWFGIDFLMTWAIGIATGAEIEKGQS